MAIGAVEKFEMAQERAEKKQAKRDAELRKLIPYPGYEVGKDRVKDEILAAKLLAKKWL